MIAKKQLPPQLTLLPTQPQQAMMRPAAFENHWKPVGGLWTSTLRGDTCGWLEWCQQNDGFKLGGVTAWKLEPAEARVITINHYDDVEWLHQRYGRDRPYSSPVFDIQYIDWEAVAEDADAVHLANPHDPDIRLLGRHSMTFYSWDSESTWWARWCFAGEAVRVTIPLHAPDD